MFWAVSLVIFVVAVLLWSLRIRCVGAARACASVDETKASPRVSSTQQALFDAQWRELAHEHQLGLLSDAHYAEACTSLQRSFLAEAEVAVVPAQPLRLWARRATVVLLVLGVPLLASTGYYVWGHPAALSAVFAERSAPEVPVSAAQIEAMVARLAQRVQQTPDDTEAWAMLARSYKVMGRYAEAARAYAELSQRVEASPALLAEYAQMLAMSGEGFKGKAGQLVQQALKMAPDDPQVLLLAGAAAREANQPDLARRYWARALAGLPPDSEAAQALRSLLAQTQ